MVLEARDITVKKYDKRALVLNGWVGIGIAGHLLFETTDIEEGVSDYLLRSQEQVEKVISLNKKLRCNSLTFIPSAPIEFYSIKELTVDNDTYASYSKCSFIFIKNLILHNLSQAQIKDFLLIPKQIGLLTIKFSSLSDLDLSSFKFNNIEFSDLSFTGTVYLPAKLKELRIFRCKSLSFLNFSKISKLSLDCHEETAKNLSKLVQKAKGLKQIYSLISRRKCIDLLPSTLREIYFSNSLSNMKIDLLTIKKKMPFLQEINGIIEIELAEVLNLRRIKPILTETEQVFTCRPREIHVFDRNVAELNKHPELFEKIERICINCNGLNLDVLPEKIKKANFMLDYEAIQEDLDNLSRNKWKFAEAKVEIMSFGVLDKVLRILDSSKKVGIFVFPEF